MERTDMNKIIIPSILVATVLIAGAFALMPVEKASTVHTTIATNVDQADRYMVFQVMTGTTAAAIDDTVLIPAKTGQKLDVAISVNQIDGTVVTMTFETTAAVAVTSDGTVQSLADNVGLQIKTAGASADYIVSIVVDDTQG